MRTKLVPTLHIVLGCLGLVLLTVYYPVRGSGGESWFFTGLLAPPLVALIFLGIGLVIFPQVFRIIMLVVHWAFIALTICAILFLSLIIWGQQGGAGALVVLIITIVMVFFSLFSALTLYLLRKRILPRDSSEQAVRGA
jgi:hypothetical protein